MLLALRKLTAAVADFLIRKWRQLLLFLGGGMLMGHLGLLAALGLPLFTTQQLASAILEILHQGKLYIVAIALVSSSLIALVQSAMRDKEFRRSPPSIGLYVTWAVVAVVVLGVFSGMNAMSAASSAATHPSPAPWEAKDSLQLWCWIAGLVTALCIYVRHIAQTEPDTFSRDEDERRDTLQQKANATHADSRGVALE